MRRNTGWALRGDGSSGEGCDASGQQIDFAATKAERLAKDDPRPSIEERYPNLWGYYFGALQAATQLPSTVTTISWRPTKPSDS